MSKHNRTAEEIVRGFVLAEDKQLLSELELTDREKIFCTEYLSNGFDRGKAAFKAVNAFGSISPNKITETHYWGRQGYKFMAVQRVKDYLATHHHNVEVKSKKPITVDSVVGVLNKILHKSSAEDKDRIKAGEILLKYLNAFKPHNEAKAPKSLTIIGNMTPAEIEAEMAKMIGNVNDDSITDAEIID